MILIKKYLRVYLTTAIILPLLITSCNSDAPVMERAEKVYYDTAQRRMKANNFFSAIESLEAVDSFRIHIIVCYPLLHPASLLVPHFWYQHLIPCVGTMN